MAPRKKPYGKKFTDESPESLALANAFLADVNNARVIVGPVAQWADLSKAMWGVELPREGICWYYSKVNSRPTPLDRRSGATVLITSDIARMMNEDGGSDRYGIYSDNFDAFMRMSSGARRERVEEILEKQNLNNMGLKLAGIKTAGDLWGNTLDEAANAALERSIAASKGEDYKYLFRTDRSLFADANGTMCAPSMEILRVYRAAQREMQGMDRDTRVVFVKVMVSDRFETGYPRVSENEKKTLREAMLMKGVDKRGFLAGFTLIGGGALSGAITPPPFPVLTKEQLWAEMDRVTWKYLKENELRINNAIVSEFTQLGTGYWNTPQNQAKANETADQVAMNSFDPTPPDGYILKWDYEQQQAVEDFVNAQQNAINEAAGRQIYTVTGKANFASPFQILPVNQRALSQDQMNSMLAASWNTALRSNLKYQYTAFRNTPMYRNLPPILQGMLDDAVEQKVSGTRLAPDTEPSTVGRRIELEFI